MGFGFDFALESPVIFDVGVAWDKGRNGCDDVHILTCGDAGTDAGCRVGLQVELFWVFRD